MRFIAKGYTLLNVKKTKIYIPTIEIVSYFNYSLPQNHP